jgi:hypothetical protein
MPPRPLIIGHCSAAALKKGKRPNRRSEEKSSKNSTIGWQARGYSPFSKIADTKAYVFFEAYDGRPLTLREGQAMGCPRLFTVQQIADTKAYVFFEAYDGRPLTLREGQAMGWFLPNAIKDLLMIDAERAIIEAFARQTFNPAVRTG